MRPFPAHSRNASIRARAEALQIVERERAGLFHGAGDFEPPGLWVDNGDRSVGADKEPVVGNEAAIGGLDEIERHAEVRAAIGNEPVIFAESPQQLVGR